jgi:transcriptional regulator with XRE-family HTH domain
MAISNEQIGRRLRSVRRKKGITQQELASALGTNQGTISNIERGVRGVTVQQLVKLARALRVSTNEILEERKSPKDGNVDLFKDRQFLRRFERINQLSKRDRQAILRTIDAALRGARTG